MDSIPQKRCNKCGNLYPATPEYFRKDERGANGVRNPCKFCHNADVKQYAREHTEENRARANKWGKEHRDQKNATNKRYSLSHAKEVKQMIKHWQQANSERMKARATVWRKNNLSRNRAKVNRYRSRKAQLPATFTPDDWRRAIDYFHGVCAYCGNPPSMFDISPVLHEEHFVPVAKGGPYTADNILPACQQCNHSKNDKPPQEWIVERFGGKRGKAILKRIQEYFAWVKTLPR